MKKVLIVGENSYIGESFKAHCKDEFQIDTINAKDNMWETADFTKYETVFHVAGIAHVRETKENASLYYTINCDLAIAVANHAKAHGVRQFVYFSTMAVYGLESGNITLETELKPTTNYGKSKLQAEEKLKGLQSEDFHIAIVRPPMVYGKCCKGNFPKLLHLADKLNFFPNIKNERSMIYITNLCEFIRLVVESNSSGIFCPQNTEYVNISSMIKQYKINVNKKCHLIRFFNPLIKLFCHTKTIKKVFGSLTYNKMLSNTFNNSYNITDFETSLKECLEVDKIAKQ